MGKGAKCGCIRSGVDVFVQLKKWRRDEGTWIFMCSSFAEAETCIAHYRPCRCPPCRRTSRTFVREKRNSECTSHGWQRVKRDGNSKPTQDACHSLPLSKRFVSSSRSHLGTHTILLLNPSCPKIGLRGVLP